MKIAFLRATPRVNVKAGGSISHISGFINGLLKNGHEVFIISGDRLPGIDYNKVKLYLVPNSNIIERPQEIASLYYNWKVYPAALRILAREKPDFIYHRYNPYNYSGFLISKSTGIPLIMEINGLQVWKGQYWERLGYDRLAQMVEDICLYGSNGFSVISGVLAKQMYRRGVSKNKIVINPNGVDPEVFDHNISGEEIRKRYGLKGKIVVGFSGTFGSWHGIEVIAASLNPVLSKNQDIRFLLIGGGEREGLIIDEINKHGWQDKVILTGLMPHEEMPKHLAACDILISPHVNPPDGSEFFGSPTKLFEYMAMEKPIIAAKVGQIGEIFEDQVSAVMIDEERPDQLTKEILRLARDPDLRKKLAKNSYQLAIKNFTWKQNANRVVELYKKLFNK